MLPFDCFQHLYYNKHSKNDLVSGVPGNSVMPFADLDLCARLVLASQALLWSLQPLQRSFQELNSLLRLQSVLWNIFGMISSLKSDLL